MLLRIIEFAMMLGGIYGLFRLARRAWKRAELHHPVEEKLNELKVEEEVASKVVNIKAKEVSRRRKKLNDFEKL